MRKHTVYVRKLQGVCFRTCLVSNQTPCVSHRPSRQQDEVAAPGRAGEQGEQTQEARSAHTDPGRPAVPAVRPHPTVLLPAGQAGGRRRWWCGRRAAEASGGVPGSGGRQGLQAADGRHHQGEWRVLVGGLWGVVYGPCSQ